MATPYLELEQVEAWLGGRPVFDNLSLRLNLGEHTVVLGPNGSGKSSLIRLLCRELYPVVRPGSSLRIFGSETVRLADLRQRMGVLSSDLEARCHPQLSPEDLLLSAFVGAVGLGRHHQVSAEQRQRAALLMQQLQLDALAKRRFGELSDGQRRRVLLARALIHNPEVLVLDEPTNGLDLRARFELLASLQRLATSGTTLLLVTHQIETILPEIQQVLLLKAGRVVAAGAASSLLQPEPLSALFETPLQLVQQGGWIQVLPP